MIALFFLLLFTLLTQSFLNTVMFLFHLENSLLLIAPIILVIVIFHFKTMEGLFALLFTGIIIDSLTGNMMNSNMFIFGFLGVFGMGLSSWLGKPHWPMIFAFLFGTSFLYRLLITQSGNFGLINLIIGPWVDMAIGTLIFYRLPKHDAFS